ncbi:MULTISPECIES: hypothetical protein [unclassified Massilia]|uniref:hypothetical protein n=1 Tax=unclassified Massilia TaxID=2609279 RepID=UPI00177B9CC7|nr:MULTISPECIES: hypothetical protein [unclassified Massilia]MBD8530577.1 hypothetical protein [Massilia sp. CFBP 13647]MBD8674801.1 hypothetical protein [Massilia sp. CFBP 13721]
MRDTDAIDACAYLYLEEIGEPSDNELRLKIVEAKSDGAPGSVDERNEALHEILSTASRIESGSGCQIFELYWPSYVAYSVRNESFCLVDAYEEFDGRLFVRYARSRYLDFLVKATFADASYPGPFVHYGIFCLNHIIDVVSLDAPVVRVSLQS